MPIPDYETIMLPLLKSLEDRKEHSLRDAVSFISDQFNLTEDERNEKLPSGGQTVIYNRVGWARTYMSKAGLIARTKRGAFKITERGLDALRANPKEINGKYLEQYPEFVEFQQLKRAQVSKSPQSLQEMLDDRSEKTPDELIADGYLKIRASVASELLDRVRNNTPQFFEKVVLLLLGKMGYGEGSVTGRSGDGGIDGLVNQDKLGLDKILFQAKKYAATTVVTQSMLRDFVGTLDLNGANKGVFITTSKFPSNAQDTISRSHKSIVLIDGAKLVQLMIDYDLGVNTHTTYEIKQIDSDFFIDDE